MHHLLLSGQDMVHEMLGKMVGQVPLKDGGLAGSDPDRRAGPVNLEIVREVPVSYQDVADDP